jgi:hypothetical protein
MSSILNYLEDAVDVLNPGVGLTDLALGELDPAAAATVSNANDAASFNAQAATATAATQAAQDAQVAQQGLKQAAQNAVPGLAWLSSPVVLIGAAIVGGLLLLTVARSAAKKVLL